MFSRFSEVKQGTPIEVFALNKAFLDDQIVQKVNLGVGGKFEKNVEQNTTFFLKLAYRTNECKPWVLPIVKEVELKLAQDDQLNKEYLPILGLASFSEAATKLLLGNDSNAIMERRVSITYALEFKGLFTFFTKLDLTWK